MIALLQGGLGVRRRYDGANALAVARLFGLAHHRPIRLGFLRIRQSYGGVRAFFIESRDVASARRWIENNQKHLIPILDAALVVVSVEEL